MKYPAKRVRRALAAGTGLALALLGSVTASAQDAVLLASTAPGYVPGMLVSTGERLVLPDGSGATLLFRTGEMLRLHGPFDGPLTVPPGDNPSGVVATVAAAFRLRGLDATVIGGTRTVTVTPHHRQLDEVVVDSQHSGTYCMKASSSVWIMRPGDDASHYALRRKGTTRALAWPSDAERIEWPDGMAIEDGDRYEIITNGLARATVTFRTLDDQASSTGQWVADGMLHGCSLQFDDSLRQLARSVVQPELYLTSDHGRRPTYRPGDPVVLTVQADTDGYLYCVDERKGRDAVPLFPSGAVEGAQIHAAVPVTIPGQRSQTAMRATAKGTDEVRCWLVDRDVSAELPHALLASPAAPLPDRFSDDLDSLFAGIEGSRIARATLDISVE
jgi:hypothetical protein